AADGEDVGARADVVARLEFRRRVQAELQRDDVGIRVESVTAAHEWESTGCGYNARRMLIQSLLDTDLYKFTMMQVVLHHFPGAQVEYRFKCRTPGVNLRPHLDEIQKELANLCDLRFREDELAYLRGLRFMKSDFVDFLGLFQFNGKYLRAGYGEAPGEIDITIRGPWLHTILYEIPVLAVISEVYFRRTQPRPNLDEGRRRL